MSKRCAAVLPLFLLAAAGSALAADPEQGQPDAQAQPWTAYAWR
jgi:hypothetical protein